jgi:hypothetical protein
VTWSPAIAETAKQTLHLALVLKSDKYTPWVRLGCERLVRIIAIVDPTPTEEPLLVELRAPSLLLECGYVEEFRSCPLSLGRRTFFTVHLVACSLHGTMQSEQTRQTSAKPQMTLC